MVWVKGNFEAVKTIFLAEDNPADVYLLREALDANGGKDVKFQVVPDGEKALDFVQRKNQFADSELPDLIVLDLNLPKSDGSDVLRCIRQHPETSRVPVVILTSSDSPKDRSLVEKLGADLYLTKPSDLDAFLALGGTLMTFLRRDDDQSGNNARG